MLNRVLLLLFESSFAFSDRNFKSNRKKTVTQKLKSRVHSNRTSMRTALKKEEIESCHILLLLTASLRVNTTSCVRNLISHLVEY